MNIGKLFLYLLFLHAATLGNNYYVSKSGVDSNNNGSLSKPWKTIQYGVNNLKPGDTLNIMGGRYNEKIDFTTSGSTGNNIVLKNYNKDSVYVDGTGITNLDNIIVIWDRHDIIIKGLIIENNFVNDGCGIMVGGACANIQILNNTIRNIHFSTDPNKPVTENTNCLAILVAGTNDPTPITNVLVKGNVIYDNVTGYSENLTINGNVDGFEVSENRVYNNTNIGIDIIGHEETCPNPVLDQARNGVVKNNIVFNCNCPYSPNAGVYVDGGKNTIIENNISYGNGYGFEIGSEIKGGTTSNITLRNNIAYNNKVAGIHLGGYDYPKTGKVVNCTVRNNTFYKNDTKNDYNGELLITQFENSIIENNIFYISDQNVYCNATLAQPGLKMDYNIVYADAGGNNLDFEWQGTNYTKFSDFQKATGFDEHSTFAKPQFVGVSITNPDFHLTKNSPAVDAGNPSFTPAVDEVDMDGENRLSGAIVDCGVDEIAVVAINKESFVCNKKKARGLKVHWNMHKRVFFVDTQNSSPVSFSLVTLKGEVVKTGTINQLGINMTDVSNGMYALYVQIDKKTVSTKAVLK